MKTNTAESRMGSQSEARETNTTIVPPSDENRQEPKCWTRQMSNTFSSQKISTQPKHLRRVQSFKIKIGGKRCQLKRKSKPYPPDITPSRHTSPSRVPPN